MQRTKTTEVKKTVQPGMFRWVNHGGPFYPKASGKRKPIPTGETFWAFPEDIPQAFRDTIKPVDPAAVTAQESQSLDAVKSDFRLKRRGETPYYDILDSAGKRINEKDLTEAEAQKVLNKLR